MKITWSVKCLIYLGQKRRQVWFLSELFSSVSNLVHNQFYLIRYGTPLTCIGEKCVISYIPWFRVALADVSLD